MANPTPGDLLRMEIDAQQIPVPLEGDIGDAVIDELVYALYPNVHEQRVPTYGAIIMPESITGYSQLEVDTIEEARMLSDGSSSFYIHEAQRRPLVGFLQKELRSELDLVEASLSMEAAIIKRSVDGSVRLFTRQHVIGCYGRQWTKKDYASNGIRYINEVAPQATTASQVLENILNVTFHELSPNNIGTTVIWYLAEPLEEELPYIKVEGHVKSNILSFNNRAHHNAIKQLISQHDGAILISRQGDLIAIDARLSHSKKAESFIQSHKGTRHTSAKLFSYDEPRALVFVVSQDGPVTVFSDGILISELMTSGNSLYKLAQVYIKEGAKRSGDIEVYKDTVQCESCRKWQCIEVMQMSGWNGPENTRCIVCGSSITYKHCFEISMKKLIKRF